MSINLLPVIQTELNRYGLSTVLVLGTIGNALVVVMFSKHRRRSCCMYLLWASVLNNIYLLFALPPTLYSLTYGDLNGRSLIYCKLRFYLTHTLGQVARFFIILACFDRYLLTTISIRGQRLTQPSSARVLMITTFLFWHISAIHVPLLTEIISGRCSQFGLYYIIHYVYLVTFVGFVPMVLMSTFGYLAYRNMRQLHQRIQPVNRPADQQERVAPVQRRDRELLRLVLAEVLTHLLTSLLYPFVLLEISVTTYIGMSKSLVHTRVENFIMTVATFLFFINVGSRFYIFFAVSKAFRRDFTQLFCGFWRRWTGRRETTVAIAVAPT